VTGSIFHVILITSKLLVENCSTIKRSHRKTLLIRMRLSCDLNKRSTQLQELLLSVFLLTTNDLESVVIERETAVAN
jgi:hypothetical protein